MLRAKTVVLQICYGTLVLSVFASLAFGQDANWWTQQYGTRSELLGGAVVGSLSDLSATFYNPGALALIEDPSVLLSAKAFEYQSVRISDVSLDDEDVVTTRFDTAPSLFTGLFPSGWLAGKLAYVFLTRQQAEFRIVERGVNTGDIFPTTPPTDDIAGEVFVEQKLSENWGGITWTYAPRDNIGIGYTQYVGYRGQRNRTQSIVQVVAETGEGGSTTLVREFDYWHYRLIGKLGAAIDFESLTVGIAATLPSVSVFGGGKTFTDLSSVGFDLDNSGTPDSFIAADSQDNLSINYRSPFSLAAGASYTFEKTSAHFTMEWFNGQRAYTVIEAEPFTVQSTGRVVDPSVRAETGDVINIGLGIEHEFASPLAVYASFTTDQSASVPGTATTHTVSTWDLYHVTSGIAFHKSGLDLTLGFGYAFGKDDVDVLHFNPESLQTGLIAGPEPVAVTYRKLKVFFGFAFSI